MGKKVLLVDDAKASRMIIGKILKRLGHEVIGEAANGELGFEMYQELKPDIVLSDIEMPILDGYEMLEKIIEFDKDANIVMITSVVNAQFIQKILSLGALDALKKPIDDKKIQKIFEQLD
jgi:two-component system chemotaxis response regulator CheY